MTRILPFRRYFGGMKLRYTLGLLGLTVALTACSEAQTALDQANNATDKASACGQALGLSNLNLSNLSVDPAKLQAEAGQKADQLQQLASQVSDQTLKQNLTAMADSYVALEQRKASELGNLNDWIQRNTENLDKLRQACL
jgi:hypothetical protein